jgi:hypothetical protein
VRIGAWTRSVESEHQRSLDAVPIGPGMQTLKWSGPHLPESEPQSPEERTAPDAAVERWALRDRLRPLQRKQQRACGVTPIGHVHIGPGWQHGLATCKNVHSCPVCSARLRQARTEEVQRCIIWWTEEQEQRDTRLAMLTLTVRHAHCDDLRQLRAGLTTAWSELWKTREGRELRARVAHYVRALDVTWGADNGWHPHIHVLLFVEADALDDAWLDQVRNAWARSVAVHLGPEFRPREDQIGCHLTLDPPRAEYLLKLGLEVTSITGKSAHDGHYGPWALAWEAVEEHTVQPLDRPWRALWKTWSRDMNGARHLSWSRALRRLAKLPDEPEQLELDLELARDQGWIISITAGDWSWTYGATLSRAPWSCIRRPSVLLGRTRKSLPETLDYLAEVGLTPSSTRPITHDGRPYLLVVMKRKTDRIFETERMQC